ncbi:MAG: molybdopterin-binding protein [Alphaproteobacteria bacterium HGW-Alphaproteobacteria-6]|nr:MAG: molybdopterin-binding protein [Alphaproteobacteria bacterium HGW-Alphaproteobacteria-6]
MTAHILTRRRVLAGLGLVAAPALILGTNHILSDRARRKALLRSGEWLSYRSHSLIGEDRLAREFAPGDISASFRINGSSKPETEDWLRHAATGFADWRLSVTGRVLRPGSFSLAELKAMPARTQITRHDCVEGWSAIGQWTGVPLRLLLDRVGLADDARFIVFRCADEIMGWRYYESLDLAHAFHPQTILAYGMNGAALPTGHGAPLRLRVERQLGYKHAKFVMAVEAVSEFASIGEGRGGFWEDAGEYEWYAGI